MAEAATTLETTMQQLTSSSEQATSLESALALARTDWITKQQSLEGVLEQQGAWVSFAEVVAPVLYSRCLACHNARTAQGRLNLESFAALMKGGESGAAVVPGDALSSMLQILIEDHSMPKDADPLTDEQIAAISNWIAVGAPLDAGVEAASPLIQVMPKLPQPLAPDVYRVPIPVTAVAFSIDGQRVFTSGYHEVLVWNVLDGTLLQRITNVAERVYDIAVHPDGQRIAIASGTPGQIGEVKIFQLSDGALLADLVTVEDSMFGVAFSPDGTRLAACGADRSIRVFDVANGVQQLLIEDHADWVQDIAWSPGGTRLASASRDKTSKVFDSATGDALTTFNTHAEPVYGVGFLADSTQVITAARDKLLRVWNAADGAEVRQIGGYGDEVLGLVILSDNRVFSCGADKVARLHNAADGSNVRNFEGAADWLYDIDVHVPTGRVVSGSYNGQVHVWNIDSGEAVLSWKAAPGL